MGNTYVSDNSIDTAVDAATTTKRTLLRYLAKPSSTDGLLIDVDAGANIICNSQQEFKIYIWVAAISAGTLEVYGCDLLATCGTTVVNYNLALAGAKTYTANQRQIEVLSVKRDGSDLSLALNGNATVPIIY